MKGRLQERLARILIGARVFFADGLAYLGVRGLGTEVQQPARHVEIGNRLKVEHHVVGHDTENRPVSRSSGSLSGTDFLGLEESIRQRLDENIK